MARGHGEAEQDPPYLYATHRQQIRSHIAPAIEQVKLEALRKTRVDRLCVSLLRGSEDKRPLASSSVRRVHAVQHAVLEEAVKGDLISRNPATHANKPKIQQQGDRAPGRRSGACVPESRSRLIAM